MSVRAALGAALGIEVRSLVPVGGGDINEAYRAELADGNRAFVKTRRDAPAGEYAAEAAGLKWLAAPDAIATPEVLAVGDADGAEDDSRWLALEWIDEGRLNPEAEQALGRGLANLHKAGAKRFGDTGDHGKTRIGSLQLPNKKADTWAEFYVTNRLEPLAKAAAERGALNEDAVKDLGKLGKKMGELVGPEEPPARLHGDLWSGNLLIGADGTPRVIDPAAYGGHREVDLAMLRLFGGPGDALYDAYNEVHPLADGHAERVELFQLLPLLAHAALFGGAYGAQVAAIAKKYL